MDSILEKYDISKAILDNSGTLVAMTDSGGAIVLFNKACSRLTGYSANEVLGHTIEDFFLLAEESAQFFDIFNRLVAGFQVHEFACHWKTKLESPRLIQWSSAVLLDKQDRVDCILFFGLDITEKHAIQLKLMQQEEQLRLALDAANEGLWDFKPQTGEAYFSPYWYIMLGYEVDEFVPSYENWIKLVHPDDRARVVQTMESSFESGQGFVVDFRMRTKHDQWRWICSRGNVIEKDANGHVVHIGGTQQDITERKKGEARFSSIFNNAVIGIVAVDDQGVVQEVNPEFSNITGIPRDQLIGFDYKDLLIQYSHPDDIPRVKNTINSLTARKKIDPYEINYNGKTIEIELPQDATQGDFFAIIRDLSKQRNAEASLHYRVEFEKLIASISSRFIALPISEIDNELNTALEQVGQFEKVDHCYISLLSEDGIHIDNTHEWTAPGQKASMIFNKHVDINKFPWCLSELDDKGLIHIPDIQAMPGLAKQEKIFFESQGIQSLIMVPLIQDNEAVGILGLDSFAQMRQWNEDSLRLLRIVADTLNNALFRKRTGLALQEREALLQSILQTAPIGIALIRDDHFEWANGSFIHTMLGYNESESASLALRDIFAKETCYDHIQKVSKNQETPFGFECQLKRKSGENLDAVFSIATIVNDFRHRALVMTAIDISEMKKAEEQREALIVQLESKNEELERFTYMVSHDLKSPLITIQGFLSLMAKDIVNQNAERLDMDLNHIKDAVTTMTDMLNDLLELSRIGHVAASLSQVSLYELASEAVKIVGGRLKSRGVQVAIDPELPVVQGEKVRLFEVFLNLIDNAAKFMGNQPNPLIEIGMIRGEPNTYFVKDNGIGIDPNHHGRIFDIFSKLESQAEGTGVGLTIVKRIIEIHNGKIWVESQGQNLGTSFYFTLWGE